MQKAHQNINWENKPSTETPINETNLNLMDRSIDTIDDRVVAFDTTKANQSDLLQGVRNVTFTESTGTFHITYFNGTVIDIDTDIEKVAINFTYDSDPSSPHYQSLILTLDDGTIEYIDLSALITQYEFVNSGRIAFTIGNDGSISADIVGGSITDDKMQPQYLADITVQATRSETASANAQTYKFDAEAWSSGTRNGVPVPQSDPAYHNNSKYWSQQANVTSLVSLTDVDINVPADGNALMYDDATGLWVNKNVNLDEVGQLAIVGPVSGQVLKYDGNDWVNADDEGGLLPKITVYGTAAGYRLGKGGQFIVMTSLGSNTFVANVTDYGQWDVYDGTAATVYGSVEVDTVKEYTVNLMIPEGSTVLPTDDVQIWLACASITDKAYTTISQVLADTATLSALIASNNAVDYMVRSTTWVSSVCADSTAMSYIGLNNYCANKLLANTDWIDGIFASPDMELVLNYTNPTMTGTTTPSGECITSSVYSGQPAYQAFDKNVNTSWSSSSPKFDNTEYIGFHFPRSCKLYGATYLARVLSGYIQTVNVKYQLSDTGGSNDWDDVTESFVLNTFANTNQKTVTVFETPVSDMSYARLLFGTVVSETLGANPTAVDLRFYGRVDV